MGVDGTIPPAGIDDLAADVGDASTSTLGSLYGILGDPEAALGDSMTHVPKYTGNILYVDGANGNDGNSGQEPNVAKKTIGAAITAASAGDRIHVKAAAYDEAINLNKNSLELICEQGTILSNSTPGTVLVVSANYCPLRTVLPSVAASALTSAGPKIIPITAAPFSTPLLALTLPVAMACTEGLLLRVLELSGAFTSRPTPLTGTTSMTAILWAIPPLAGKLLPGLTITCSQGVQWPLTMGRKLITAPTTPGMTSVKGLR